MFLGVDIGTSAVKVVAVDGSGNVADQVAETLTVQRPGPLMSEQDPAQWWSATRLAIERIPAATRARIQAIGLTGQMHGATLLDGAGAVIRPAILWNDGRSARQCAELEARVPRLGEITGNAAMPGFTAPKLLWLQQHEPESFARMKTTLLPKDYVRLRLTGDLATDMSDAAGTLWLDTRARSWSEAMLDACNMTQANMPTLFEGSDPTGVLRAELAQAWGMARVPVAAGGSDNAAGAVGSGTVRAGAATLSLGTSGVIFVADTTYRACPARGVHSFCHALPGRWHQMSVMLSTASAVDWVATIAGYAGAQELCAAAAARNRPNERELFLPYLTGERTPHNNPHAQGVFFGLTPATDQVALAQAALEGVAFALADGLEALLAAGAQIETLSVIGGGAQSAYWGRILSSVFDRPLIYRQAGAVGPAYGAARLARLALTREDIDAVCETPPITAEILPSPGLRDQLAARHVLFRSLYTHLLPLFQENG